MQSIEDMIEEVRALHNHICVVHDMEMARVIGFHQDAADVYYHVRRMNAPGRDRNDYCASYVGACISLVGLERYDQIDSAFASNGSPRTEEFLVTKATREEGVAMYGQRFADGFPDDDSDEG